MTTTGRRAVAPVAALVAVMVVTACGGSTHKTSAGTTPTPAASSPTAPASTAPSGGGAGVFNCGHGPGTMCAEPATAHLTVTPDTGLTAGQTITLVGTGFAPNSAVGAEECTAVVRSNNDCDTSTAKTAETDSTGHFTLTFTVKVTITTVAKGSITCTAAGNCSVGASNFAKPNAMPTANVDVGFAG